MTRTVEALVVIDRQDRHRAEYWTRVLGEISKRGAIHVNWKTWPLSEKIVAPLSKEEHTFWEQLSETGVLIINWDAVNGDPDFGADLALRWFEVRWPALRHWLNDGGTLIIEGQAVLGVPSNRAYASLLGPGEIALSGAEDQRRLDAQSKRIRGDCRMTRVGRSAPDFEYLDTITPVTKLSFDHLFPPQTAGRLLAPPIRRVQWEKMLYRGWFMNRTRRGKTLRWIPYARRARRWPFNYATLLVAKCEPRGVVFATTMLLAATGQVSLIESMLLSHGRANDLPDLNPLQRFVARYLTKSLAGLLSALILLLFAEVEPVPKVLLAAGVGLLVALLLDAVPNISRSAFKLTRVFTGG